MDAADITPQAGLPTIPLSQSVNDIAEAVIRNIPEDIIFLQNDRYVTIETDPDNGHAELREMTPKRLITWLSRYMRFIKRVAQDGSNVYGSVTAATAEVILASDTMRRACRPLRLLLPTSLPARSPEGIRILRPGYDAATKTFTAPTVNYARDNMSPAQCRKEVEDLLSEFPWLDCSPDMGNKPFAKSANVARYMAYVIGQYCMLMVPKQPMIILNANQRGSGKTLLAQIPLAAIWGTCAVQPMPKDEDMLSKVLFSHLIAGSPYLLLDDLTLMASGFLNQYATAKTITDRKMGAHSIISVENNMQMIGTGNDLKCSKDVERRSIIIDLFAEDDVLQKEHANVLTEQSITSTAFRERLLRILHSMVQNWASKGCPVICPPSAMASFEGYPEIVGSIVIANGFADPFAPRESYGLGGDVRGEAIKDMLIRAADLIVPEVTSLGELAHTGLEKKFTINDFIRIAENNGTKNDIIGNNKNEDTRMGMIIREWMGRKFRDGRGRTVQFQRRRIRIGISYTVTILSEPVHPLAGGEAEERENAALYQYLFCS